MEQSVIHSSIDARDVGPLKLKSVEGFEKLARLGICLDEAALDSMITALPSEAMDALQPTITTGSINTPVQFLQNWLPGFVNVITQARKIDDLTGIMTAGAWEDEEVVQGVMELTGTAVPYGDYTNVPLASWNVNFERRTNVRFEEGMMVGKLEAARAGRMRVSSDASKRAASTLALEIQRNAVGFYGYNDGAGRTYGFLNDPSLPAYVSVPASGTGGSTNWSEKTFLEITADLREAYSALRTQSGDTIDPEVTPITIAIATNAVTFLTVTSDFGISVRNWITQTYPKTRIVSAPQLDDANGGEGVFYMYAETVQDNSTDDGRTFIQVVPAKFMVVGVEQKAKGYLEDYSNATAGVMCKRPYAVVRRTGISNATP